MAIAAAVLVVAGAARGARAAEPVIVTADVTEIRLGRHVDLLEDPGGSLTIEDVLTPQVAGQFRRSESDVPNFGFSESAFWIRFALRNDGVAPIASVLELGTSDLNQVTLYAARENGGFDRTDVGNALPFASRIVPTETFGFPERTPMGEQAFYLRLRSSGPLQAPLTVWSPSRFARRTQQTSLEHGLFVGAMLVMLVYNLFLLISVREASYGWYVAYVASFTYMTASLTGLTLEYLWPASPWLDDRLRVSSFGIVLTSVSLFNRSFLDLPRVLPRWNVALLALAALGAVELATTSLIPYRVAAAGISILAVTGSPIGIIAGLKAWRRGQRSARFYVLGWSTFFSGASLYSLNALGLTAAPYVSENAMKVGSLIEVVLISFALADRMNQMKAEKEQAQGHLLAMQRDANENLRHEVARQTQELRDQATKLVELDRQKTHFFQNVSHELRTPLTLILNPLDELTREAAYSRDPRIDVAIKNARRLLRLVNQLLDFQKLAAGKKEWHLAPIDAAAFARSCSEYFAPACKAQGVAFEVRADDGDALVVRAEADALEKIVFNYLANALKFTPRGKAIELSVTRSGEGRTRIAVKDEGPGISEEGKARLFQLFSQIDTGPAKTSGLAVANEGTGLGLALAKELAEAMGGIAGVESTVGHGATFFVELPRVDAPAVEAKATGRSMHEVALARASEHLPAVSAARHESELAGDGARVLVVDDLADMRDLVARTLVRRGYRVTTASGGREALDAMAARGKPDLIVTDWMMPGMSGPELVAAIRADADLRAVPVVLLTAKSDEESKLAGTEIGADAFLGKPFNESELVSTVRNLVQLKEREREVERLNRHIAENVLKRYLPAPLVDDILAGRTSVDVEPETVQATILFSDLVGFTRLSARLRAAKMARVLNEYLGKMNDVVFAHGGTVDKYMGDGIMVIFGAPVRLEAKDQVRRAAACAIAMQHAMADLNVRWVAEGLPEIKLRIGLHHGPVVVGNFGDARRSDYTAIGPTVNLASRIEGASPEGGVLVSGEVYDFLPEQMAEDAGAFELKGIEGAVRCFRLVLGTPSQASLAIH